MIQPAFLSPCSRSASRSRRCQVKVAERVLWKISRLGRKIGVIANQSVIGLTIYTRFASRFFLQLPV
jgi:hypothetical protein